MLIQCFAHTTKAGALLCFIAQMEALCGKLIQLKKSPPSILSWFNAPSEHGFLTLSTLRPQPIVVAQGTCCRAWRRSPWRRPARWCGWRWWRPAGCWSRSASPRGWSSWGASWGRTSTASPGHAGSHRGRSYTPWPPSETPPDPADRHTDRSTSVPPFKRRAKVTL